MCLSEFEALKRGESDNNNINNNNTTSRHQHEQEQEQVLATSMRAQTHVSVAQKKLQSAPLLLACCCAWPMREGQIRSSGADAASTPASNSASNEEADSEALL